MIRVIGYSPVGIIDAYSRGRRRQIEFSVGQVEKSAGLALESVDGVIHAAILTGQICVLVIAGFPWKAVVWRLTCPKGQPKSTAMWLRAACLLVILAVSLPVFAGTITGQIQTATGGTITNGTLTFTLSQPAVLSGAALLTQPAPWDAITSARFEEAT
jgi:hypothetical protein